MNNNSVANLKELNRVVPSIPIKSAKFATLYNKKGQTASATLGFALGMVFLVLIITLFVTIEPFKETLDEIRGTSSLNCQGTVNFNSTAFAEDETSELNKLTRRPTCFITGLSMVWFIFAIMIASGVWFIDNWRKIK